jgi:translocation and assembly module TamB
MALVATAERFRVSAKPDQRLVVSGKLNAQLSNARLVLRGALVADQALFVLPEDTAPKLGADVVVKRKPVPGKGKSERGPVPASSSAGLAQTVVPDISVTLDPGSNFLLQGHGISTRLAGLLTLKAEGINAVPRLQGELRTVAGTYRAYGQNLNIEQGTLRFSGAYDNPALDIRAVRPNLSQEVGVEISGTAQLPVVRLYSDPDLPDADKLSWLVLGHAASTGGAETAMLQQAALALLAGTGKSPTSALVNAFGIDEVSLGQAATTNLDGSSGTETTVKLGKRISRDFYVAYERGISGTFGTFYVFYDLSRRFTLRGQSGSENAVDLIFTTRFD